MQFSIRAGPALPIGPAGAADPSRWVEAIAARARNLPRGGAVQLRFTLQPEDLGTVQIRIESRGDELRIRIGVSSAPAADALQSGLPRLVSQLQEAGIRDPQVAVLMDHSMTGEPHERREAAGSGRRGFHAPPAGVARVGEAVLPDVARDPRSLLDLMA